MITEASFDVSKHVASCKAHPDASAYVLVKIGRNNLRVTESKNRVLDDTCDDLDTVRTGALAVYEWNPKSEPNGSYQMLSPRTFFEAPRRIENEDVIGIVIIECLRSYLKLTRSAPQVTHMPWDASNARHVQYLSWDIGAGWDVLYVGGDKAEKAHRLHDMSPLAARRTLAFNPYTRESSVMHDPAARTAETKDSDSDIKDVLASLGATATKAEVKKSKKAKKSKAKKKKKSLRIGPPKQGRKRGASPGDESDRPTKRARQSPKMPRALSSI